MNRINVAVVTADNPEMAPVSSFTADLEKEPVTGYDENIEPNILDVPRAINSCVASTRYPRFAAIPFAIAIDSRNPIKHTIAALGKRSSSSALNMFSKEGNPSSIAPTILTPCLSS